MRVALIDGGSFVLTYDYQLAETLAAQGVAVEFHGSRTRYNGEFLEAMRRLPGVTVRDRALSRTVAPRWKGALGYLALWCGLWLRRAHFDAFNLQFSASWPLELPFLWALRKRLVFTVHNAVPHDFAGRRHGPTERIARLARTLVFVSRFSHDDFIARYGEAFRAKSRVLGLGRTPVVPGLPPVPYRPADPPEALVYWSTVKPYKGVELFVELARSPAIRAAGLGLEIHGPWAPELAGLKAELAGLGVHIDDGFLDPPRLLWLLARNVVFLLPYREATQSGAMFSLLHHGRVFLCSDVGDLGDFLRRFGLEALLLKERSAEAVVAALERLRHEPVAIAGALQAAQDASAWAITNAGIAAVYAGNR
ncbi:MAG: glycosyltransferase [Burkholderiales bacterium]|nr:glycosyltransferase [Burkholderiales bacterium]